MLKQEVWDM